MLNNKVILVVGGATGIGRATAELCAARGAAVVVADIDPAGQQVAVAVGGLFVPVNVTEDMIGHKFGEFSPTRTFYGHSGDKKAVRAKAPTPAA